MNQKLRVVPPRRERDVQTEILRLLHAHRIPAWKVGSGAFRVGGRYVRMGQKGMADIIGLVPVDLPAVGAFGRFLAIEVKVKGRDITLEQLAFLDVVRRAGGIGLLAYSCDDVKKGLSL